MDAIEHPVQRLGEALQLVARVGHRQSAGRLGEREGGSFGAETLDRPERGPGEDPPETRHRGEQDRATDRDDGGQAGDREALILHVLPDDERRAVLNARRVQAGRYRFPSDGDFGLERTRGSHEPSEGGTGSGSSPRPWAR